MHWTLKQRFNKGAVAEQQALDFLQQQGLQLITRNYAYRGGELDLIMQDQQTIVFIEVRQRSRADYGNAQESIGRQKQLRLLNCAQHYLQHHKLHDRECRIDVLAANGQANSQGFQFEWIKNAITL